MPFKPTLVAKEVEATDYPYLGFPITEVVLTEPNGQGAGIPKVLGFDSRDKITESVTGTDSRVARRKLADLEMMIDYVTAEKKAEIERLILNDRTVFFCPNFGPETRWSWAFQGTLGNAGSVCLDGVNGRRMTCTRNGRAHVWDPVDRVIRSWESGDFMLPFRGAWTRYLRTVAIRENHADKPHPDSSSSGWTSSGTGITRKYVEGVRTPLLQNRASATAKGSHMVSVSAGGSCTLWHYNDITNRVSATKSVVGTVCIRWTGSISVYLERKTGPFTVYDSQTNLTGDGGWQMIHLGGLNSDATQDVAIRIAMNDATSNGQTLYLGPVHLGNGYDNVEDPPRIPDWEDETDGERVTAQTGVDYYHDIAEATITWFGQYVDGPLGFLQVGSVGGSAIFFRVVMDNDTLTLDCNNFGTDAPFTNMASEFSLTEGEWCHFALVLSGPGGVELYVNGEAHSSNGNVDWESADLLSTVQAGGDGDVTAPSRSLERSGMSHLRLDLRAWTQAEVVDHYDTYFRPAGRGVVEPLFGKQLIIESVDWAPQTVSDAGAGNAQWRGTLVLRELGPEDGVAGLQRQEGGV